MEFQGSIGEDDEDAPNPDVEEIRKALSGNLCRCTGYQKIVAAVAKAAGDLNQ